MSDSGGSFGARVIRGVVAGIAGTWVMDLVTTALLEQQSEEDRRREQEAAPFGQSSVSNLVDRLVEPTGAELEAETRSRLEQGVHFGLGVGPAVLYALAHDRVPLIGAKRGLVFGALVWAFNDEILNTSLGLSGPPEAYPASSHVRGLVGHLVLGVVVDTAVAA